MRTVNIRKLHAYLFATVVTALVVGVAFLGILIARYTIERELTLQETGIASFKNRMESSEARLRTALETADDALKQSVQALEEQSSELKRLRTRSAVLEEVIAGGEDLALAYRALLDERTVFERALSALPAFAGGLIGGLLAILIVFHGRLRDPRLSADEKKLIERLRRRRARTYRPNSPLDQPWAADVSNEQREGSE